MAAASSLRTQRVERDISSPCQAQAPLIGAGAAMMGRG
jgi:hypothetical protein